jgi:hypothetical protein
MKPRSELKNIGIGVGSEVYVVGLFHYIYGQERNMPMSHTGNIALLPPEGERIPMWNSQIKQTEKVDAYLIESAAINGASGSPVFVRGSMTNIPYVEETEDQTVLWTNVKLMLLGIFTGAWFGPPDDPVAKTVKAPPGSIVPVGVGVVVPAYQIIETMETPEMQEYRSKNRPVSFAAQQTAVSANAAPARAAESQGPQANDANPTHREDFTRLLGAAARKPPQER